MSVGRASMIETKESSGENTCTIGKEHGKERVTEDTSSIMFSYQVTWEVSLLILLKFFV